MLQVLREKDASSLSLPVRSVASIPHAKLHMAGEIYALLSEDVGPLQLTLAGAAQGTSYAALGYLVLHDTNIWGPNMAGLCANVVCLVLIGLYSSPAGKTGKQLRD